MPIYEYRCEACEKTFELLTSYAERDRAQSCPACESRQTRVLVSSFAAVGFAEPGGGQAFTAPTGGGCCGGSCGCGH